jgi:hypothetical protein
LSVRNDHASITNDIQIQHTDGTNVISLWKGTLLAGEMICFTDMGWQRLTAGGVAAIIAFVVLVGALLPTDDAEPAAAQADTTPPQLALPASAVPRATSASGAPCPTLWCEDETAAPSRKLCAGERRRVRDHDTR